MKIIEFNAENIKRLRVVQIRPDGALVQITGPNGSGKSSILDAIMFALGGASTHDAQPIRRGAEKAKVVLDLGEFVVTRRFTEGGTSLTIEDAEGITLKSPQGILDKIVGKFTFDPLAFAMADPKTRLQMLKDTVTLDVDLDALDSERRRLYDERTDVSRRAKQLESQAAAFPSTVDAPTETVSVAHLAKELDAALQHNAIQDDRSRTIDATDSRLARLDEEIRELEARREALGDRREEAFEQRCALPAPEAKIEVEEFRARIASAEARNSAYYAAERGRDAAKLAEREYDKAAELTRQIEDLDEQKRLAMANAKFPVDGLTFGDGEVTLNGLPFSQASSAEQLRASVALAMASNPTLRVLRIKDGSLLDEQNLALLESMAELQDYQVWIERVDTRGTVGVVMLDGHVVERSEP